MSGQMTGSESVMTDELISQPDAEPLPIRQLRWVRALVHVPIEERNIGLEGVLDFDGFLARIRTEQRPIGVFARDIGLVAGYHGTKYSYKKLQLSDKLLVARPTQPK